ncbi:VTT domain-containing protein [Marinobacter pelagius]|uniref:TVP38/TMEM64 family protein n=1 Tax=Marinobacter sp. C7 TaxID=2951363 RepID=UPI001EEFE381|nr:VTT domain-containing protein [Marinobacter sp. C7]MCG7200558.1 VTT domain-containing protein [Marinobacter sp. C7]
MHRNVRGLAIAVLALAGYLATQQGWLDFLADQNRVATYLHGHGGTGFLAVTLAGALFTGLGAPRQLLAFVLGFALGGLNGTLLSTLATAMGAAGGFFTARWLLRGPVARRFGQHMEKFDGLFRDRAMAKVLLIRLLPVGSNLVTNLVAGCTTVRFAPFLAGSVLGYLPQMLVFALAGAGIGSADKYQLLLSVALLIPASLLGVFLYRNHRTRGLVTAISEHS